ncbi:MAG TPA: ATP-binding cassette domain-containing protein [Ilumatobacter sp.]|nr:ATP-binding cassette domain-containing protein [Ilumatobacter sp.]
MTTNALMVDDSQATRPQSQPAESLVDLAKVSFAYAGGALALNRVSISVPRGKVTTVVGPSGCGKSTLLALLSGMRRALSGSINWSVDHQDRDKHPVSMMFQKDTLLPWLTVEQNAGFFGKLHKHRRAETTELAEHLLETVGLTAARKMYPYQLSGGMRRRLAFVVAMSARPRLLLLDEPFSALDEPTRVQVHQSVLDVFERQSTTVVLVTHDLAEAASLSDQIVMLSRGPGQVVERYGVGFGDRRDVLALREQADFQQLVGSLWHDLRSQLTPPPSDRSADESR